MRRSATTVGVILLVLGVVVPSAGAVGAVGSPNVQTSDTLNCEFPYTSVDASGTEVTITEEPETIVTLNPSAAQTLWEIGGREKVVGISQFGTYLDGANSRTVVTSGFPSTVNVEKVINLQPDLVLAPNTINNESVKQIRDAGITVYRFELATSIESVIQKTKLIGRLTGECAGAEKVATSMRDSMNTIEAAVEGEEPVDVYWGRKAQFTAGPNTFIGKAIEQAGGHNIAAEANSSRAYPQLSAEFIAAQNPEYVIVSVPPSKLGNASRSYIPEGSVIRNTTAYEKGNIVVVNTNNLSQPAPRIVSAMKTLAKAFHPEAYAEANTTQTTSAATTSAQSATATTTGSSNAGSPGFGVTVTVVSLLGAVLFARR